MQRQPSGHSVDLLVIGAGPAGMTAALVARLEGLTVMLAEKTGQVGGTAATSAGTLWIPGNPVSAAAGHADAPGADAYLRAVLGNGHDEAMVRAFLDTGPQAIRYLEERSAVRFASCGDHPDYYDLPGAAVRGRAILAREFDGRLLGRDFRRVRPPMPEFLLFGGMMVAKTDIPRLIGRYRSAGNFLHAAGLMLRYLRDRLRYPRGTRLTLGNALVARLYHSLRQAGVQPAFEHRLERLVVSEGRVTGAELMTPAGPVSVAARRGVVLATGGIAHTTGLQGRRLPEGVVPRFLSAEAVQGEGVRAGLAAGARMSPGRQGTGSFWTPASVIRRRDGGDGLYPHLSLDRSKPGLIAVDRAGRRFCNEAVSYHDFVLAMFADPRAIPAWLVCSAAFVRRYGLGAIRPGEGLRRHERSGYITTAPTLEALAGKLGIDPAGLAETVARHDRMAAEGVDRDFAKGETVFDRFNGDPAVQPNPCLAPLGSGPYVAVEIWPAEIVSALGLDTDPAGRVLGQDGAPVPGLYACGNDMASVMAGTAPGPGTTLGPGIVFGYRAAMAAAGRLAGDEAALDRMAIHA